MCNTPAGWYTMANKIKRMFASSPQLIEVTCSYPRRCSGGDTFLHLAQTTAWMKKKKPECRTVKLWVDVYMSKVLSHSPNLPIKHTDMWCTWKSSWQAESKERSQEQSQLHTQRMTTKYCSWIGKNYDSGRFSPSMELGVECILKSPKVNKMLNKF